MFGDTVAIGDGVKEVRIHYGPGFRLYFIQHGKAVIILLCGGDKSSQKRDINLAKRLAREWRQDHG
jgi:putative addiction module killer protein